MEYPSNKPNPTFDSIEEAARYYQDAFDAQFRESARCQRALLEIRMFADQLLADRRLDLEKRMVVTTIKTIAEVALNFSEVQDTNPGTGEGSNAGFSGPED